MSGDIAHMPTCMSDTSTIDVSPVVARLYSAMPMAPAMVLAPCRSKNAAGWGRGSIPPRVILNAMPLLAHPQAMSYPPTSAIGPSFPQPVPRT